ncbi:hypothetical protein KY317_04310 [Candidatus Woesearchaeota archaeon]|nr:hypothetical protein [Candidatus Woesearchaeota archaeon]
MKKSCAIILLIFFILIFPDVVLAVGISPFDFETNMRYGESQTFQFYAVNTMNYPMNIEITAGSEYLSEFTVLEHNLLYVQPNEWKPFTVIINYPSEPLNPGIHSFKVSVTEKREETGMITARASVSSKVKIREAYPGIYAEAQLKIQDKNINEIIPIRVILNNYGTDTINTAGGFVDIYFNEEKVKTLELSQINDIETFASKMMSAEFDTTGFNPGRYTAKATVTYDEKTITAEGEFKIGTLYVDIIDFTKQAQQNKINPFEITIESKWNEPISNVYADVNVMENNLIATSFKTISVNLEKWEQKTILGYLDAEELSLGIHDVEIYLNYHGHQTIEKAKINLTEETLPLLEEPKPNNLPVYLTSLIAVLIAVIMFLILSRRKKNARKESIKTYQSF